MAVARGLVTTGCDVWAVSRVGSEPIPPAGRDGRRRRGVRWLRAGVLQPPRKGRRRGTSGGVVVRGLLVALPVLAGSCWGCSSSPVLALFLV